MKHFKIFVFLYFISLNTNSQTIVEPSEIKWYTIEEAEKLYKKEKRPLFIDVYTDWCGWCKHMMKTTFANKGIASYINNNFYPVRFNAETSDTIQYKEKTYVNIETGKRPTHQLAKKLLNNRMSYPSIVYIDRKGNLSPIPGYMKAKDIEPLLIYFAEDLLNNVSYEEFKTYFLFNFNNIYKEELQAIPDSLKPDTNGIVKWYTFAEAAELSKRNKNPVYLNIYTDWCQSCKISEGIVFKNPIIAEILNKKFYPVRFNAATQDTINVFEQTFTGTGKGNPHQLVYVFLKQNFKLPADIYINSKQQILNEMHGFLTPSQFESILMFFGDKIYEKKKYQEYMKEFKGRVKKRNN